MSDYREDQGGSSVSDDLPDSIIKVETSPVSSGSEPRPVSAAYNKRQAPSIHRASNCKIRVLGIGGGGCNTLQHMINESLAGVEFIAINTDEQILRDNTANTKVQIGIKLTNGLGAGCDPNKGRKAAEESKEDIKELLRGSDMVFITTGMGGGTGTGAAPIIAEIAKETGALTVAVVTRPFKFEGKRHMVNAEAGITELSKHVDSLIVIDNDKLLKNLGANISVINAFNEANDVLLNAVRGITDTITRPGYINLDYEDIKTVMRGRGHAMIGNGMGKGPNFVEDAIDRAIHSPLIDPVDIQSAAGLLVNVRINPNFPINKWEDICNAVQEYADEEADCKFGMTFDENLAEDEIGITILITGISSADPATARPKDFFGAAQPPRPQQYAGVAPAGGFTPPRQMTQGVSPLPVQGPAPQPVETLNLDSAVPAATGGMYSMPVGRSGYDNNAEIKVPNAIGGMRPGDDDIELAPLIMRSKSSN